VSAKAHVACVRNLSVKDSGPKWNLRALKMRSSMSDTIVKNRDCPLVGCGSVNVCRYLLVIMLLVTRVSPVLCGQFSNWYLMLPPS
jgi:hypothetical protein